MNKRNIKFITTLLILVFLLLLFNQEEINAATGYLEFKTRLLSKGDEGADVAILQRKLKELSYYNGLIDGLYGPGTEKAVRQFQLDNNLQPDGIVGSKTYNYLPENNLLSRMNTSRDNIILLARIIHGEARGESFKGKVAVGAVVLNRVEDKHFPDNIRDVILQEGQFSSLDDGQANLYPSQVSIDAARAALIGYDPTFGSMYFYNPEVATNLKWIVSRPVVKRIGEHVFAR